MGGHLSQQVFLGEVPFAQWISTLTLELGNLALLLREELSWTLSETLLGFFGIVTSKEVLRYLKQVTQCRTQWMAAECSTSGVLSVFQKRCKNFVLPINLWGSGIILIVQIRKVRLWQSQICYRIVSNWSLVEPGFKTLLFWFYLSVKVQLAITYSRIHSLTKVYI